MSFVRAIKQLTGLFRLEKYVFLSMSDSSQKLPETSLDSSDDKKKVSSNIVGIGY